MRKTFIGGLVGGIILFVWGAVAWKVLPLHEPSMHRMSNEDAVMNTMRTSMGAKGVYFFPAMVEDSKGLSADEQKAAESAWMQKYRQGPTGMIVYDPNGSDPLMPSQMVVGLILSILLSSLAAWFLVRSTAVASPYIMRVTFCGMLGILISFGSHLLMWNWMGFPLDYTTAMVADTIIGWLLAGLGIGAIVKSPKMEAA